MGSAIRGQFGDYRPVRLLLLLPGVLFGISAAPPAEALADLERARLEWSGPNDFVDMHVVDSEGNQASAGGSTIPNTTYLGNNTGERVNSFIDLDDPSTRTFCFQLDNYGSEPVAATLTLTDPDGTTTQTTTVLQPGEFVEAGSSPENAFIDSEGRCVPDVEIAERVAVEPVSGQVLVKPPGATSFQPLVQMRIVRTETQLDTTFGRVLLTSETQDGGFQDFEFFEGRFEASQKPSDLVTADLLGTQRNCRAGDGRGARGGRQQLWGKGKGNTKVKGKGGAASSRGTEWLTRDLCNRKTLVAVRQGSVIATDFADRSKQRVRAGERVILGPRPPRRR